jgi:hypothetical protein
MRIDAAGINPAEHVAHSMQRENDAWQGRSLLKKRVIIASGRRTI